MQFNKICPYSEQIFLLIKSWLKERYVFFRGGSGGIIKSIAKLLREESLKAGIVTFILLTASKYYYFLKRFESK